jgi:uncharacterized protein
MELVVAYPRLFLLQELLHRYLAIRAGDRGRDVFEGFAGLMEGRIQPIRDGDVVNAAALLDRHPRLQARDLLHLAVMQRLGVTRIISANRAFDDVAGVERLDPAGFEAWRDSVLAG